MSSAARTNLSSQRVSIDLTHEVGRGAFRIAYAGTYEGGQRNQQEAVCKCFKDVYKVYESEFFATDERVVDKAIQFAEDWNNFCESGKQILITKGDVKQTSNGTKYLIEPFIRNFCKYTSNNGWINEETSWEGQVLEAFTHYSYHKSGGSLIICDLQGRYRNDRFNQKRCRFELTDPAICSRYRGFGPTDLGEKGIETFFANHQCNQYCEGDGARWAIPRSKNRWFSPSSSTSMLCSSAANLLVTTNRARFTSTLQPIYNYDESDGSVESDEMMPMRY